MTALFVLGCAPPPGAGGGEAAAQGAASAEQACKRAGELATKDGEPAEVAAKLEADCSARLTEVQGLHDEVVACMQAAADFRQLKACELPITTYESMFAALAPSPEALCDHVVTLMMNELGDQVPQDQLPMIRDKCVADATRNAEQQGASFAAQARCVMEKSTIAGLKECEPLAPRPSPAPPPRPAPASSPAAPPSEVAPPSPPPPPSPNEAPSGF